MISWLYGLLGLSGLTGLVYIVYKIKQWANADLEKKIAQNETKAHETRNDVEDSISRDNALDKRLRLRKWMRRVQADKTE
jgi:hypothetical protein